MSSEVWKEFEKSEFATKVAAAVSKKDYSPILDDAHPKGGTVIPDVEGDALVEDLKEQQQADLQVATKNPTGKIESLFKSVQKISKLKNKKDEIVIDILKIADALDVDGYTEEAKQLDEIAQKLIES